MTADTRRVVFVRHAQSLWNLENRFSGWADMGLSEQGVAEAHTAGQLLRAHGFAFDRAFTSLQRRAMRTLEILLAELGLSDITITTSWRLNERHYGALEGMNKDEVAKAHGPEFLREIRRGYRARPPALSHDDPRHPRHNPLYANVDRALLPAAESLEDTERRIVPLWETEIMPEAFAGKRVLVVSHGNSLRALVRHLDQLSETEVVRLEIPTGRPLVYEFDPGGRRLRRYYLEAKAGKSAAS